MKTALVCGAGGFIGSHLVKRLKSEGFWVRGIDLKYPEFSDSHADDFILGDLREFDVVENCLTDPTQKTGGFDEVYQLAADMGGAGYIFTGENDANIMHNSAQINLNVCSLAVRKKVKSIFYSSSACMYPSYNQQDTENPKCSEDSAYPADPDSEYGWEKLFSERLYLAFHKNYNLNVHIARYHNIFGPEGTWDGGREKAPAALCRKVIRAKEGDTIEIWGTGKQTRSFLYIDECVEGTTRLMRSNFSGPVNIGSEEMVSINGFAESIIKLSGKNVDYKNVDGPVGVNGRNSDNALIQEKLHWQPSMKLYDGLEKTYAWIQQQVEKENG
tara:strand:- start:51474 stop:52460 length:987 start_codon:yes stop_codon:yes gene_type:complete